MTGNEPAKNTLFPACACVRTGTRFWTVTVRTGSERWPIDCSMPSSRCLTDRTVYLQTQTPWRDSSEQCSKSLLMRWDHIWIMQGIGACLDWLHTVVEIEGILEYAAGAGDTSHSDRDAVKLVGGSRRLRFRIYESVGLVSRMRARRRVVRQLLVF